MKVIIAGSRTIEDYELLLTAINRSGFNITEIVSGTATGVDQLGEIYGALKDIPVKQFPAKWKTLGKKAGPIRNREMGEYADAAIILWDGKSSGTKNMINTMSKLKKPYYLMMSNKTTVDDFF